MPNFALLYMPIYHGNLSVIYGIGYTIIKVYLDITT